MNIIFNSHVKFEISLIENFQNDYIFDRVQKNILNHLFFFLIFLYLGSENLLKIWRSNFSSSEYEMRRYLAIFSSYYLRKYSFQLPILIKRHLIYFPFLFLFNVKSV